MADLLLFRVGRTKTTHLNLWCTPCGEVHDLAPSDVERIVYALAAAVPVIYEDGFEDGGDEFGEGRRDHVPDAVCLQVVLAEANTGQQYLGQVTEAVANREQAGPIRCQHLAGVVPSSADLLCGGCGEHIGVIWAEQEAAGGRVQTRVVGEGPPAGWVGLPEARAIAAIAGFEQAISETGQRIAEGAELDAERAGRVCQHDTIRVEDHDGILRCAGCQEPTPRGAR